MSVTQKDFRAIAQILKDISLYSGYSQPVKMVANRLCDYFQQENPKFKKDLFLKACGVIESDNL